MGVLETDRLLVVSLFNPLSMFSVGVEDAFNPQSSSTSSEAILMSSRDSVGCG